MIPAQINNTLLIIPQSAEDITLGQMIDLAKALAESKRLLGKEHKDYPNYSEDEFETLADCEYAIILVSCLCKINKDKITNGSSWEHLMLLVQHLNLVFQELDDPQTEVLPVDEFQLGEVKYKVKSIYRSADYGREFSDRFTVKDYIDSTFLAKKAQAIAYKNQYEHILSICTIITYLEEDATLTTEQLVKARKARESEFRELPLTTAMELYFFFVMQSQTLASVSNLSLTAQMIAELKQQPTKKGMVR